MTVYPFGLMSRDKIQAAIAACAVTGLLMTSALVSPAAAQDDSTAARMARMEAQMDTLSRAVFKGDVPASAQPSPLSTGNGASTDYQASVETRLSDLEKQLRDMTGKVEQLSFENNQLKGRLDKALTDIDMRLNGTGASGMTDSGGMTNVAPPSAATVTNAGADDMSNVPPPKQSGTLAPQDMGGPVLSAPTDTVPKAIPAPKDINAPAPANSPTIKQLGTLNEAPGGASIPSDTAKDATAQYEMAFSELKSGNFAPARSGFEAFLKNNAGHPLAANATYWLGESYYGQGEYDKAARVFAESYKKYPQGPKVADSLLKMGMALGAGGKKKEACVTLQQLKKEFPTGQGVTLRRADQEMSKLACNG